MHEIRSVAYEDNIDKSQISRTINASEVSNIHRGNEHINQPSIGGDSQSGYFDKPRSTIPAGELGDQNQVNRLKWDAKVNVGDVDPPRSALIQESADVFLNTVDHKSNQSLGRPADLANVTDQVRSPSVQ